MSRKTTTRKQKQKRKSAAKAKAIKKLAEAQADEVDASAGPTPEFANAREFAKAITKKRNLVEVASALLGSNETKGASVRARMFETTLEYLFGKPAVETPPEPLPVRVVWDIPMNPPDETRE
jgi:hypothetical protein